MKGGVRGGFGKNLDLHDGNDVQLACRRGGLEMDAQQFCGGVGGDEFCNCRAAVVLALPAGIPFRLCQCGRDLEREKRGGHLDTIAWRLLRKDFNVAKDVGILCH